MIYTFRTRCELIKHLHALCELSGSIEHSALPMKDFEIELPYLMSGLFLLKQLAKKFSNTSKLYIAFRTSGFESSTIFHHFKSTVTSFHSSVIACYAISFSDGHYCLQQISFN